MYLYLYLSSSKYLYLYLSTIQVFDPNPDYYPSEISIVQ